MIWRGVEVDDGIDSSVRRREGSKKMEEKCVGDHHFKGPIPRHAAGIQGLKTPREKSIREQP